MKRIYGVLVTTLGTLVVGAGTALAQTTYPPTPTDPTSVLPTGGSNDPGTAFTGSDTALLALVAAVLLVAGLGALFVARRRSARAATA